MCCAQVLLHPALVANLHGAVCVALVVVHLGGAANEGEVGVLLLCLVCRIQSVLQTVNTVVQCTETIVNHVLNVVHGRDGGFVLDVSRTLLVLLFPVGLFLCGNFRK